MLDNDHILVGNNGTHYSILGDRIIVKTCEVEKKHNLFLPESSKEEAYRGVVMAIGDGRVGKEHFTISLKKNDTIVFQKWSTNEFMIDGEKYLILSFKDVIGVKN